MSWIIGSALVPQNALPAPAINGPLAPELLDQPHQSPLLQTQPALTVATMERPQWICPPPRGRPRETTLSKNILPEANASIAVLLATSSASAPNAPPLEPAARRWPPQLSPPNCPEILQEFLRLSSQKTSCPIPNGWHWYETTPIVFIVSLLYAVAGSSCLRSGGE